MPKYLCTRDGGQWNIPVEIEGDKVRGLYRVRGTTSDLVGYLGSDGLCYTLAYPDELFDTEQLDNIEERTNVVPIR